MVRSEGKGCASSTRVAPLEKEGTLTQLLANGATAVSAIHNRAMLPLDASPFIISPQVGAREGARG